MSSVLTPRACSTAYSASPKSSPTGPTTRTSSKNDAASEKCTADPPSRRSRSPNGVLTASNAIEPTTVMLMAPEPTGRCRPADAALKRQLHRRHAEREGPLDGHDLDAERVEDAHDSRLERVLVADGVADEVTDRVLGALSAGLRAGA